jgi:hypothetical protein
MWLRAINRRAESALWETRKELQPPSRVARAPLGGGGQLVMPRGKSAFLSSEDSAGKAAKAKAARRKWAPNGKPAPKKKTAGPPAVAPKAAPVVKKEQEGPKRGRRTPTPRPTAAVGVTSAGSAAAAAAAPGGNEKEGRRLPASRPRGSPLQWPEIQGINAAGSSGEAGGSVVSGLSTPPRS